MASIQRGEDYCYLSANDMTFDDFAVLVDQKDGGIRTPGRSTKTSATLLAAGLFCCPQSAFGVGMRNPSAHLFGLLFRLSRYVAGLVISTIPDVVRYLCNRRH